MQELLHVNLVSRFESLLYLTTQRMLACVTLEEWRYRIEKVYQENSILAYT